MIIIPSIPRSILIATTTNAKNPTDKVCSEAISPVGRNRTKEDGAETFGTKARPSVDADGTPGTPARDYDALWTGLVQSGKALDYTNRNWKNRIRILYCSREEAKPFFPDAKEGSRFDLRRCAGLTSARTTAKLGRAEQTFWVDDSASAGNAFAACAHEAFHAAAFALATRSIPLDLREPGARECLGFFVEDILREALPVLERRIGVQGSEVPRKTTRRDGLALRAKKGAVLAKLEELGLAFTHHDTTWRAFVPTVLCNAKDSASVFERMLDEEIGTMEEDDGGVWLCSNESSALVWADTSTGARNAFIALSHGAIHAAATVLANCGVDVNVAKVGASECVAYFIQNYLDGIRPWFLKRFAAELVFPSRYTVTA